MFCTSVLSGELSLSSFSCVLCWTQFPFQRVSVKEMRFMKCNCLNAPFEELFNLEALSVLFAHLGRLGCFYIGTYL